MKLNPESYDEVSKVISFEIPALFSTNLYATTPYIPVDVDDDVGVLTHPFARRGSKISASQRTHAVQHLRVVRPRLGCMVVA